MLMLTIAMRMRDPPPNTHTRARDLTESIST